MARFYREAKHRLGFTLHADHGIFFAWNHPQQATVAHDGSTFDADEGNDAQLVVFEALPHAFWYRFQLPETKEALEIMARFF
jgi:hypothetical protein